MMHYQVSVTIEDPSQVGEARRMASQISNVVGLDEVAGGKLGIVATELATNILKHAGRGEILFGNLRGPRSVDVIALDRGPGISNLEKCVEDGFSSAGTAGHGLGAILRQSASYEIYTHPIAGTAIIATVGQAPTRQRFEIGVVCRPVKGEIECGDGWAVSQSFSRYTLMVADGLGHGLPAYSAASQAMHAFGGAAHQGPSEILQVAHAALRATRGAAVAVAEINADNGVLKYAGVGNVAGVILSNGTSRSMVSHNGIVGGEMRRLQEFSYPWTPQSTLVMNSDGIATQWHLDKHPGLISKSPQMIAAVLYRDFQRVRDDSTVIVLRQQQAKEAA